MAATFRVMVTSDTPDAIACNLAIRLSSIQRVFSFDAHNEPIPVPSNSQGSMRAEELEAIALDVAGTLYPKPIPILITRCDIDDESFSSFDGTVAVISIRHWGENGFSPWPVERFLLFTVADVLMGTLGVETPVHPTQERCVGDRCEEPKDVNACLEVCGYCPRCRRLISSALSTGKISPQALGAIHRILDSAAERRRVFVLMPFDRSFDPTYRTAKRVAERCGWQCNRADDIVHTRDILSVIWEEIERCELVIADLTERNANVFYELGYAHAIGKNTILLTQNLQEVPFDLRHRVVIQYQPNAHGRRALAQALRPHLDLRL